MELFFSARIKATTTNDVQVGLQHICLVARASLGEAGLCGGDRRCGIIIGDDSNRSFLSLGGT